MELIPLRRRYPITDDDPGPADPSGRHAVHGGHDMDAPARGPAAGGHDADRYPGRRHGPARREEPVDRYAAATRRYGARTDPGGPGDGRSGRRTGPDAEDLFTGHTGVGDPGDDPHTDPHGWEPVAADPAPDAPRERGDAGPPIPLQRGRARRPRGGAPGDRRAGDRARRPERRTSSRPGTSARAEETVRSAGTARPATSRREAREPSAELTNVAGPRIATLAVPVAVGTLVAVALGVWAREHDPTGVAVNLAGFSGALAVKTWLGSAAMALGLVQLWSALVVTGRIGRGATALVRGLHRWSGRAAVLVTVPVAVQCLIALGWSGATPRALVHSLLGCLFYGAFVTKMLLLRRRGVPGWAMAVAGGLVFALLTGIWLTSAAWFFGTRGLTF